MSAAINLRPGIALPQKLSLRFRLNLMIALTILLIVGLGTLFAVHNARRSVLEEIDSTVNLTLQLIEAGFAENGTSQDPLANWLSQVGKLDKTRHLRIQVRQAPDQFAGSELGPQNGGPVRGGLQGGSPPTLIDVSARRSETPASAPAWFAWAVTPEPIVAEKWVESADRSGITILIEANPGDEIAEAWNEAQGFLMLIALLAVAVYALVHITVGRAFRSVGVIMEGLEDIEKGDYGKRLPDFPLPEFSRISQAFNHTASALEKAHDENKALMQQNLAIQEEERRCLAQELHDELGQSLSAIKVMAQMDKDDMERLSLEIAIDQTYFTTEGIFGVPLSVAGTYVILFIIFGAYLEKSGAGQFFMNFANADMVGHTGVLAAAIQAKAADRFGVNLDHEVSRVFASLGSK